MGALKTLARPFPWACLIAAGVALAPATSAAQDADRTAAAQALFEEAASLLDAGHAAEACPKLEQVVRLRSDALGARLRLADCYEQTNRLASAWSTYVEAAEHAERAGQSERAAFARGRAKALDPRVPRLTIEVPSELASVEGLVVRRGDLDLERAMWNVALPVDAGEHVVSATAPSHAPWSARVELAAGEKRRVAVPPLIGAASDAADGSEMSGPDAQGDAGGGGVPVWAWVSGSVGVGLGLVAVVFAIDQAVVQGEIDACDPNCGAPDRLNDRLNRDFGLAVGLGSAGLVGIVVGVVGIATAGSGRDSGGAPAGPTGLRVAPVADGISVAGEF